MENSNVLHETISGWPGVSVHPHRFGGREYRLGKREIGHVHAHLQEDRLVDIPFPKKVRDEVVRSGEAEAHHILPESGWVSIYLRDEMDVERAILLLHRSYRLAVEQREKRKQPF